MLDRLARAHLVEVIGRHILQADAPEAVAIALNGRQSRPRAER